MMGERSRPPWCRRFRRHWAATSPPGGSASRRTTRWHGCHRNPRQDAALGGMDATVSRAAARGVLRSVHVACQGQPVMADKTCYVAFACVIFRSVAERGITPLSAVTCPWHATCCVACTPRAAARVPGPWTGPVLFVLQDIPFDWQRPRCQRATATRAVTVICGRPMPYAVGEAIRANAVPSGCQRTWPLRRGRGLLALMPSNVSTRNPRPDAARYSGPRGP